MGKVAVKIWPVSESPAPLLLRSGRAATGRFAAPRSRRSRGSSPPDLRRCSPWFRSSRVRRRWCMARPRQGSWCHWGTARRPTTRLCGRSARVPGTSRTVSGDPRRPWDVGGLVSGPHGAGGPGDDGRVTAGVPATAAPRCAGRTPRNSSLYADLLDSLGIDRAVVLGISGGGPSSYAFAAADTGSAATGCCAARSPRT